MEVGLAEVHDLARGVDAQLQVGVAVMELRESRQQPLLQKRCNRGDVERAGATALAQLVERGLQVGEAAADSRQQQQAFRRQFDVAAGAPEQRHLQVILERLDLHAHRRGRDVQGVGGGRKAQPRGDGLEDAQRVERQPVEG